MNTSSALAVILIGIGIFLFVPFLLIWSINGLFAMTLAYTWTNWFYALIIMVLLRGSVNNNSK
jgi:hypothetical protein